MEFLVLLTKLQSNKFESNKFGSSQFNIDATKFSRYMIILAVTLICNFATVQDAIAQDLSSILNSKDISNKPLLEDPTNSPKLKETPDTSRSDESTTQNPSIALPNELPFSPDLFPSDTPSPNAYQAKNFNGPTLKKTNYLEPYHWRIQMAEMAFSSKRTPNKYAKLVTARLQLLEAACLLPLINQSVSPNEEECLAAQKTIESEFPTAPPLICVKEGLQSEACDKAHIEIALEDDSAYITEDERAENDYLGVTDPHIKIRKISEELIKNAPYAAKDEQDKMMRIRQSIPKAEQLLKLACPEHEYGLYPKNRYTTNKKEKKTIQTILERPKTVNRVFTPPSFNSTLPTTTPTPTATLDLSKVELVKLRSSLCREQIRYIQSILPEAASITCSQYGYYSGACQRALGKEKEKFTTMNQSAKTPSSNSQSKNQTNSKQRIFKSF
jgi:hypothetical protein